MALAQQSDLAKVGLLPVAILVGELLVEIQME
jgi:hypothetical protein